MTSASSFRGELQGSINARNSIQTSTTAQPRVVHVVRQYLPSIGGMEEVVRNIARHQVRAGQGSVRILTLNRLFRNSAEILPEQEVIDGIDVIRLPFIGSSRYPLCPTVLKHLKEADVIHVHGVDFFYDFLAATKWLHRRPLVLSTHGGFFHTGFASRAKQLYFRSISRLSALAYSKVVATSNNDGELFQQICQPRQLQVIENGVDVEKYAGQAAVHLTPTLIYFGRWSANKGLLPALQLFARLYQLRPEWRLIIAGREYDHSQQELAGHIHDLGLSHVVTLAANPSDEQIRALIQQASYFLCLSRHEGFGIAPIEAMSAGLTPILSEIPPFRRLVDESHLGYCFDPERESTAAIARLLQLHQQGDSAYRERRTNAQEFATNYAWPAVADNYMSLYRQLSHPPE